MGQEAYPDLRRKGSVAMPFLDWIRKVFRMKVLIAGGEVGTRELATAPREAELEVCTAAEPAAAEASVAALAARLRALEQTLTAEQPDAVLVADDTDTALAALLAAAKLGVPSAAAAGVGSSSPNGRLIAQLADERLRGEPGGLADWARNLVRL